MPHDVHLERRGKERLGLRCTCLGVNLKWKGTDLIEFIVADVVEVKERVEVGRTVRCVHP